MQIILSTSGFFCKQQLSAIGQQLAKYFLLIAVILLKIAVPNKKILFQNADYPQVDFSVNSNYQQLVSNWQKYFLLIAVILLKIAVQNPKL